jgi:hypothetical protein
LSLLSVSACIGLTGAAVRGLNVAMSLRVTPGMLCACAVRLDALKRFQRGRETKRAEPNALGKGRETRRATKAHSTDK